jgi:hypothetical protein
VDAQQYDAIVRDAQQTGSAVPVAGNQQMTFVFAAGNAGSGTQTVGSPGTAKNVITVGAAENVHSHATTNGGNSATGADGCDTPDSEANSANDVATFSSRGPCADSRKKPEIMAPGTHVTGGVGQNSKTMTGNGTSVTCFDGTGVCALPGGGTVGSTNNFFPLGQKWYSTSSGTSHSTPAVAGGAALVYQWFLNNFTNAASPAMIKAFLMNAARYMNGTSANDTLYSNNQGMGMMNLGTAFDGTPRLLRDQLTNDLFTASGQSRTFTGIVVSNSKPVRITLTWTDAPGSTSGNAYKNNLDLTVVINGTTYRGNVFSGANSIAGGSADVRNNAESVFLPAGTTGSVAITIGATSINSDGVPNYGTALDQDFALVAYNVSETQSPAIATAGSALIAESCGAGNSAVDPSENVTVALALRNVGTANTTNVVATLQTSGGVTSPSGAQNYGALTAGGAPSPIPSLSRQRRVRRSGHRHPEPGGRRDRPGQRQLRIPTRRHHGHDDYPDQYRRHHHQRQRGRHALPQQHQHHRPGRHGQQSGGHAAGLQPHLSGRCGRHSWSAPAGRRWPCWARRAAQPRQWPDPDL